MPELARFAAAHDDYSAIMLKVLADRLAEDDGRTHGLVGHAPAIGEAAQGHDAVGYIRANLDFHRTLYLRAQAPAMLAIPRFEFAVCEFWLLM